MAKLILVGLPIGNAQDISKRVYACLERQRKFLVEDTRNFKNLLGHYGLPIQEYKLESFHEHNKNDIPKLIARLAKGEDLYLASDAGSPVISDPAFPLIRAAVENGHEIDTLAGASSPIVALELSGLPPLPFMFWGFLPRKDQQKQQWFSDLDPLITHISFESPVRMQSTLDCLYEFADKNEIVDVDIAIARELTKLYQQCNRFELKDWLDWREEVTYRGEMVLLIHKRGEGDKSLRQQVPQIQVLAEEYLKKQSPRNLSKLLASVLGGRSNEYYQKLKND